MKKRILLRTFDTCRACNMELLPVLVEYKSGSKVETPSVFCDEVCERMYSLYPGMLGKGYKKMRKEQIACGYPQPPVCRTITVF